MLFASPIYAFAQCAARPGKWQILDMDFRLFLIIGV